MRIRLPELDDGELVRPGARVAIIGAMLVWLGWWWTRRPDGGQSTFGRWFEGAIWAAVPHLDSVLVGFGIIFVGLCAVWWGLRPCGSGQRDYKLFSLSVRPTATETALVGIGLAANAVLLIVLSTGRQPLVLAPLLWVMSIVLCLAACVVYDRRNGISFGLELDRTDRLWIIGLTSAALVTTTIGLVWVPALFMGDEMGFWTFGRDIAQGKAPPVLFDFGVSTYPKLSTVYQALVIRLFGLDLWSWRFSSALAGAAAIPAVYLWGRELHSRTVGVVASVTMLTSAYFLAWTRSGFNNSHAVVLVPLALVLLYFASRRGSTTLLLLAGVVAGLGFYTYLAARSAAIVGLLWMTGGYLARRYSFRRYLVALAVFGLAGWIVVTPHLVCGHASFPDQLNFKMVESVFCNAFYGRAFVSDEVLFEHHQPIIVADQELFYHPQLWPRLLVRGVFRTAVGFVTDPLEVTYFVAVPFAGTIAAPFFLIGLVAAVSRWRRPGWALLVTWFFFSVVSLSVTNTFPPRHQHMVDIMAALAVFTALGVLTIAESIALIVSRRRLLVPVLVGAAVLAVALAGLSSYFRFMPTVYRPNLEHLANWAAFETDDLVVVWIEDFERLDERWRPIGIEVFDTGADFLRINPSAIGSDAPDLPRGRPTLAFFHSSLSGVVVPWLERQWGSETRVREFTDTRGVSRGVVAGNTAVDHDLRLSLSDALKDLARRPVRWFLLLLAVAFLWALRRPKPTD